MCKEKKLTHMKSFAAFYAKAGSAVSCVHIWAKTFMLSYYPSKYNFTIYFIISLPIDQYKTKKLSWNIA